MNEMWSSLSRIEFTSSGFLIYGETTKIACKIWIAQLYNGRIIFEAYIDEKTSIQIDVLNWFRRCKSLDFVGTLNDGQHLIIKNINNNNVAGYTRELDGSGGVIIKHTLYNPGFLEITKPGDTEFSQDNIVCEVTNLPLNSPVDISIPQAQITFQRLGLPKYNNIRSLMNVLKTAGVLSQIRINFSQDVSEEQMDEFINLSCGLLSIAQRAHVWCVARHWKNSEGAIAKSRYEEPIFHYSRPSAPLIPVESLGEFFQSTIDNYRAKYDEWDLGEAQEHYLQSMQNNSMWSQSLGFFTALETLKAAYLCRPEKKNFERYVPKGRFRKKKISDKVMDILRENFEEFRNLLDADQDNEIDDEQREKIELEKQTLKSKVGELNRRAYKLVLKSMFKELGMAVEDEELKQLVDLRNQIIHNGSPDYEKWTSPSKAGEAASKFCGLLLEESLLAILGYKGNFSRYDQLL